MNVDLTEAQVFAQLRAFLLQVLPAGTEVIRTQVNRVAPPKSALWVAMTARSRQTLATTIDTWDQNSQVDPTTLQHLHKVQLNIQLDFYGETSADAASTVAALFRTTYCVDFFTATGFPLAPLYATDGNQMPLISGEEQYISRWTNEVALQANLTVSTNQDYMDSVAVDLVNVEVVYPPGA